MEFDTKTYLSKLNNSILLNKDEKLASLDKLSERLFELAKTLRVARLEVKKQFNDTNRMNMFGQENPVLFSSEDYDPDSFYVVKNVGNDIVFSDYYFYNKKNDIPFSDQEKENFNFLSNIIYLVASNYYLNNHLKFSRFHEMRFKNVYNLAFMHMKLNQIIAKNAIDDYGIILFNLHNFGQLNKTIGEKAGTEVLERYFNGINEILGNDPDPEKNGFLSALGGDNGFIIFKKHLRDSITAYLMSTEMKITTDKGTEEYIVLHSRFGINMELEGFNSVHRIIDTASISLNIARKTAGVNFIEYDESFKKKFEMQMKVEAWYKNALRDEEFLVYYQPKVDLHNYTIKGAEALVRWIHNEIMIYPDQFIPVLENNLSIKYLDIYMLNHVCQDIRMWLDEGKEVPQISVNLSRATLGMRNLIDVITTTIDKYNVPRSLIQIELTESASDVVNDTLRPLVEGLSQEGISTAVDDFGTGFSSMSLIKELPWNVLKIDKSLLMGAQKDGSSDQLMFKSIISMANTMGLECIVEGVETKDDVRILKESGCFMAQGYYFSKPKPKEEFEKQLNKLA